MHHKFAIFDETTLWTGSFNWTVSANTNNCENVIITDDREACRSYQAQFNQLLKTRCKKHIASTPQKTIESHLKNQIITIVQEHHDDDVLIATLYKLLASYSQNTPLTL